MNIVVSNLDRSITSLDLRRAFAGYGTIINTIVVKDTDSGKPLGHGHVYLVPDDLAKQAIEELDLAPLKGRPIRVRECVIRAKRDRRARRPGGGIDLDRRNRPDRRRSRLQA